LGFDNMAETARATQGHHLHRIQAHAGVPAPLPLRQRPRGQAGVVQRHQQPRGIDRHLSGWLEEYKGTDRVTGSPQVDRRTALIDHFRKDDGTGADIMIATEAGAEGVNLQFCALIINYDLPWNPQRVEQRIGRCHRYGQRYDVVVINFLNTRNQADQRVLELLTEKFNLFSGVFGASMKCWAASRGGIDFEKRILQIYDTCRQPEEIEAAFNALQTELEESSADRIKRHPDPAAGELRRRRARPPQAATGRGRSPARQDRPLVLGGHPLRLERKVNARFDEQSTTPSR
jgi:superfamily II DNA/RNA helicase